LTGKRGGSQKFKSERITGSREKEREKKNANWPRLLNGGGPWGAGAKNSKKGKRGGGGPDTPEVWAPRD